MMLIERFKRWGGRVRMWLAAPSMLTTALFYTFTLKSPQLNYTSIADSSDAEQGEEDLPGKEIPLLIKAMESRQAAAHDAPGKFVDVIRERIAVNIFLQSGYLESVISMPPSLSQPTQHYRLTLADEASACTSLSAANIGNFDNARIVDAGYLAVAAVAVEKFNRTPLHRSFEWRFARSYLWLTGRLPDISLGAAQIKVSTIRRIAAETANTKINYPAFRWGDAKLAELLEDECRSLNMTAAIMLHLGTGDSNAQSVANHYAGARRRTEAAVDYGHIVATMAKMIDRRR